MSAQTTPAGVTERKLGNGMTVLVKEDHTNPVVAIVTYVKVGYFNEPDSVTGISHQLEHLFFKGTKRRGVGDLAKETKARGGYLNAGTIYDRTSYYTVLPASALEAGLDIQSDALWNSVFNEEELEKEKKVVIQEVKRKFDRPDAMAWEKLIALTFDKHHFRRWRMGSIEQVSSYTRAEAMEHYQRYYQPENIILVVVGDIDTKETLKLINKYYAGHDGRPVERLESPEEPAPSKFKYKRATADIKRRFLNIGFHAPGLLDEDYPAIIVAAQILGSGESSRLSRRLKETDRSVDQIAAEVYAPASDLGVFYIESEPVAGKLEAARYGIFEEIERLRVEGPTAAELNKAKTLIESGELVGLQTVDAQANRLARWEAYGGWKLGDRYLDKIAAVTAPDVVRVLSEYARPEVAAVYEYLPTDDPTPEAGSQFAGELESHLSKLRGSLKPLAGELPGGKRERSKPLSRPDTKPQRRELENGATLIVAERHSIPWVAVHAYFPGGPVQETADNCGISNFCLEAAMKGTKSLDAKQIAERIESLGASLSVTTSPDYCGYRLSINARRFDDGMAILADVMQNPTFAPDEVDKEREQLKAAARRRQDSMYDRPLELFRKAQFTGDAYALDPEGNESSLAAISVDNLRRWHRSLVRPGNVVWVVYGDINDTEIARALARMFPKGKAAKPLPAPAKLAPSPTTDLVELEPRSKAQTALALGFRTCAISDPDYPSLKVLQSVASGMGGRLFTELRDKRSLCYTVRARQQSEARGGAFFAYIASNPEDENPATDGLKAELRKFVDTPVGDDELERARNYLVGVYPIALQTLSRRAAQWGRYEIIGGGFENADAYPAQVAEVTAKDVQTVAKRYFNLEHAAMGIVRGESKN